MTDETDDFDFEAWASSNPMRGAEFGECITAAIRHLALNDGDLRSRLRGSLFCLLCGDPALVPPDLRPAYDEIAQYVAGLIGNEDDLSAIYKRKWRIKIKTARRLARQIMNLYEQATAQGIRGRRRSK